MQKVEGARVDRQLLEHLKIEVGLPQKIGRGDGEDIDRPLHEIAIPAVCRPHTGHEDR